MAKHTIEPRGFPLEAVLEYLGRSRNWFNTHRRELIDAAFPKPHPILKLYDIDAVKAWWDKESGMMVDENPDEAEALRRIHGKH